MDPDWTAPVQYHVGLQCLPFYLPLSEALVYGKTSPTDSDVPKTLV